MIGIDVTPARPSQMAFGEDQLGGLLRNERHSLPTVAKLAESASRWLEACHWYSPRARARWGSATARVGELAPSSPLSMDEPGRAGRSDQAGRVRAAATVAWQYVKIMNKSGTLTPSLLYGVLRSAIIRACQLDGITGREPVELAARTNAFCRDRAQRIHLFAPDTAEPVTANLYESRAAACPSS